MDGDTGWGRTLAQPVYQRLVEFVEAHPEKDVFKLSLKGVKQIDVSFASEAVVELVRKYQGRKSICVVDVDNQDIIDNLDAAAARSNVPVTIWPNGKARVLGPKPSQGNKDALAFVLSRSEARAADFTSTRAGMSIANASTKLKQLWEQGFIRRNESAADSGGVEFLYKRIG